MSSTYSGYAKSASSVPPSSSSNSLARGRDAGGAAAATTSGTTTATFTKPPPISSEESRQIARVHFKELREWLTKENAIASSVTRNNAREKLARLTRQQFGELSEDCYDELIRRITPPKAGDQPFLAVRDDFHPKRNQARQKLATLPLQRFRDLASDVYFDIERRYPEFLEELEGGPAGNGVNLEVSPNIQASPSNYSPQAQVPRYEPSNRGQRSPPLPNSISTQSLSNVTNFGSVNSLSRRMQSNNDSNVSSGNANGAGNDVVVPNKSTLVMEQAPPLGNSANEDQNYRDTDSISQRNIAGARASEASSLGTRFLGNYATTDAGGGNYDNEQQERLKSNYEYKITMLQNRVSELEQESRDTLTEKEQEAIRARDLDSELRTQRERYEVQTLTLQRLRTEFETLQTTHKRSLSSSTTSDATVARLRQDLERLTREQSESDELVNDLKGEVSALLDELRDAHKRYEDLIEEREKDKKDTLDYEEEAKEWRRKYEQAKVELRNVKATSQLFVGSIKVQGDYMPASADGLISDVHVSTFQVSIDDLLNAARSKEPSSVLPSMRAVVNAVENIDNDVQSVDPRRITSIAQHDQQRLVALKTKTNDTLSNLMTASKNHAMSFGVSPVSLLDAAASHLSSTVVDLVRILKIRRTGSGTNGAGNESIGKSSSSNSNFDDTSSRPLARANGLPSSKSPQQGLPPSLPLKSNSSSISNGTYGGIPRTSLNNARGISSRSDSGSNDSGPSPRPFNGSGQSQSSSQPPAVPSPNGFMGHNRNNSSVDRRGDPFERREGSYRPSVSSASGYGSSILGAGDDRDMPQSHSQASTYEEEMRNQRGGGGMYGQPGSGARNQIQDQQQGGERERDRPQLPEQRQETPQSQASYDENWEELKNYLENQTEAIVHSIQSLLSAIRSGAQGSQLNENLTQIITIVSSIVAISKGALSRLPTPAYREGEEILRELTKNCDKLSEMQEGTGAVFTKVTKQAMASASFGVAKSLKALNSLLASGSGTGREDEGLM